MLPEEGRGGEISVLRPLHAVLEWLYVWEQYDTQSINSALGYPGK